MTGADDLTALAARIAAGKIGAAEVVCELRDRAERFQPQINCFIATDFEPALREARAADAAAARCALRGPLHGVPVAHKDMFYRAGRISTAGSKIRAGYRPRETATVLERLDRAGALEIGRLNLAEFALYPTGRNEHYGDCRNPWATERTTGGSSSGSAAAVAAGLCYGSLGSDSGGSIRVPASLCGVTGLKPTTTRVSRHGIVALSFTLDHVGPIARSVRDVARLLGVIAGADGRDETAAALPVPDYEAGLEKGLKGLKIGVPSRFFFETLAEDVAKAVEDGIDTMRRLGAEIAEVDFPDIDLCAAYSYFVLFGERAAAHGKWLRTRLAEYGALARIRLLPGLAVPMTRYYEALARRGPLLRRVLDTAFAEADLLYMPTVPITAPLAAAVHESDSGHPAVLGKLTRNARIFNYLGLPALTLPCGSDRDGLPIGAQMVGKPFAEARLLRAGHAYQRETDWHRRMPRL